MNRKGFTLIELLVVIAIIAILAAILFPVFARARSAAKTSMCSSGFKQVGEAQIMYRGENGGKFPPTNWTAAWAGCQYDYHDQVWVTTLQPFVKDWKIFRCPSDVNNTDAALTQWGNFGECPPPKTAWEIHYAWALRTDVGFNYIYLSPVMNLGKSWGSRPVMESMVASTSSTIENVDSIWNRTGSGAPMGGGNWVVIPPARVWLTPDGRRIDTFEKSIPPGSQFYDYSGWDVDHPLSWQVFGGCWPWHIERCMTVFVDSHCKALTPSQLAAGVPKVQYNYGGPITDIDAYIWDTMQ